MKREKRGIGVSRFLLRHIDSRVTIPAFPRSLPARMVLFLGSSLGNMTGPESDRFFRRVRGALSAGDYFLLGADLLKSRAVMEAAYNDAQGVSAAFNLNMLPHLNRLFRADFDPGLFRRQAVYDEDKREVDVFFCCCQDHTVKLESHGFEVRQVFTDRRAWFGLLFCQAAG